MYTMIIADRTILRRLANLILQSTPQVHSFSTSPFNATRTRSFYSNYTPTRWPHQNHFSTIAPQHRLDTANTVKAPLVTIKTSTPTSISPSLRNQQWTAEEDKIIKESLAVRTKGILHAVTRLPHRTYHSIKFRRGQLRSMKQRRQPYRHWTAEEDQIIIDSLHRPDGVRFAIDTLTPTSTLFGGRTVCSIFSRRAYLGRDVDRTNSVRKFLAWTLEESKKLKTLIDQNQGLQPHELREHFPGRTLSALAQRYWIITKEKRRAETLRIPHLESESDSQQKSEATEGKENSRYDPVRQRPWVQEENERIHQHFETLQRAAASKLVARTSPLSPSSPPFLSTSLSSLSPMPSPPLPTVTATDLVESLMSDPKWDRLYSVTVLRVKRMLKGLLAPQSRNQQQHGNDRQYLPSCSTHWTKDEEARIISAVADQVGSEYRPQLCFQGSNFQFPPKPAFGRVPLYSGQSIACQEEVAEKETRRKRPYLTPGSPALDRIDWQLVADKVETRTAGNCRQRFYNNLSIRSKIAWDAKELKRLDEGLTKFGPDMQALSIYVGTRSPRQCQNKLWYLDMQERKWSQKK